MNMFNLNEPIKPYLLNQNLFLGGNKMNTREFIKKVNELNQYKVKISDTNDRIFYVLNGPFNREEDLYYQFKFDTESKRMDVLKPTAEDRSPFADMREDDEPMAILYLGKEHEQFSHNDSKFIELLSQYANSEHWNRPNPEWLKDDNSEQAPKPKKRKKPMTTKRFIKKVNAINGYTCELNEHDDTIINIKEDDIVKLEVDTAVKTVKFDGYIADQDKYEDRRLMSVLNKYVKGPRWDTVHEDWIK